MASVVKPMKARCLPGLEIVLFVQNAGINAKNFVICDGKLERQVSVEAAHKTAQVFFVVLMGVGAFE